MYKLKAVFLAAVALLFLACGGGGGGTGTSIRVTPSLLTFSALQRGAAPPAQVLSFTYTGDGFLVGTPAGESMPSWLGLQLLNYTASTGNVQAWITDTSLAPGTYRTTLRFVAGHQDGSGLVQQDVPITYTVAATVAADPVRIDLNAREQVTPAPVTLTLLGTPPFQWSVQVAADGAKPSDWLSLSTTSGRSDTGTAQVQVIAAARDAGSYSACLVVKNADGTETARIPVTYTVAAGYTLSAAPAYSLTHASDASALDSGFDIAPYWTPAHGAAVTWTLASDQPWLTVSPASGTMGAPTHVTTHLDPAQLWSLPNGTRQAQLTLSVSGASGQNTVIPVTLSLALDPVLTLQGGASFSLDNSSTDASLAGALTVVHNLGGAFAQNLAWTAVSSAPWLQLTTASGSTANAGQVAFRVDKAALAGLASPASATITVTPGDARVARAQVTVPLTVQLARPTGIAPYVAYADRSGQVVLRGSGFAGGGPLQVSFGGTLAAAEVVDDTEIRVTAPALAAQRVPVRINNGLGLDLGGPDLVVVPVPAYVSQDLVNPGGSEMLLDAERGAVLTYGYGASQIARFRMQNGVWTRESLAMNMPTAMAVAPDGKELLAINGAFYGQILANHLDPATLNLRSYDLVPASYSCFGFAGYWNDGACWLLDTDQWSSLLAYPQLTTVFPAPSIYGANAVMSRDRNLMVLGAASGVASDGSAYSIPANGKAFAPRVLYDGLFYAWRAGLGRDGSRFVHMTSVYDKAFNRLGALTPETYVSCLAVAPDNSFVVVYDDTAFRLHPLTAATGPYPATQTLAVGLPAGAAASRLAISDDGGALFVLYSASDGTSHFKVVPLS